MYGLSRTRFGLYKIAVIELVIVYVSIASAVPLLHSDDCPQADGKSAADSGAPSGAPCPACKFVGNSNAAPVPCESAPALTRASIRPDFVPEAKTVVQSWWTGSIVLRGPPAAPLS